MIETKCGRGPHSKSVLFKCRLQQLQILVSFKSNLLTLCNHWSKIILVNFLLLYRYSYRYLNYFEHHLYSGYSMVLWWAEGIKLCTVFLALVSKTVAPRTQLGLLSIAVTAVSPRSGWSPDRGLALVIVVQRAPPDKDLWFRQIGIQDFSNVLVAMWMRLQCSSCALWCEVVVCSRNCPEKYNGADNFLLHSGMGNGGMGRVKTQRHVVVNERASDGAKNAIFDGL